MAHRGQAHLETLLWGVTGMWLTELIREYVGEQPMSPTLSKARQGREGSL